MNLRMLKPTILSVSLLTMMASAAVSPALGEIGKHFSGIDQTVIKLILTLPSLVVIPFSLLAGFLASRTTKKNILFVGLMFYILAGIGGGFAQTITQLLIIRGFLGIGIGLIMPLSSTLIVDFFEGHERNKMMGLQATANQLGGMILLPLAGWLAFISWRYAFGVYGLGLITALFIWLWLPESPQPQAAQSHQQTKIKIPFAIFGIAGLAMMMMVVFYVVATDLALFIDSEKAVFSSSETPLLFSSDSPLFKDREEFIEHLKQGTVSSVTRDIFQSSGYTLSDRTRLKEIQPQREWEIVDGIKTYIIKKEENRLMIYAGLGTAGIASNTLAVMSLSGALAGFLLSYAMRYLKNHTAPFAAILMGLGYATLGYASGIWMLFAAMGLIGLGCGLMTPPLMLLIPRIVTPASRAMGTAIVSSSLLFGQFASPVIMKGIAMLTGNDTFRFRFYLLAIVMIASALTATLIIMSVDRSKRQRNSEGDPAMI
jgi:MFS family permease